MSLGSATSSTVPSEAPSTPHRRSASPASTITTADGDDIPVSASAAASPAAKDLAPPAPAAASPSSSPKSHQHHPERPSLPSLGGSGRRHRRASSTHRVKETMNAVSKEGPDGTRTVNHYKLGPEIGKGAYGRVELGIDVQTGEKYAVKEYSKSRLRKQDRQRSLAQSRGRGRGRPVSVGGTAPGGGGLRPPSAEEAEASKSGRKEGDPLGLIARELAIMKKLDHPNVIHLYEALDVPLDDSLFMVLEYCPGGILMNVPGPGQPTPPLMAVDRVKEYFGQILMGLEYLHENDVAHRDIKPENILFTADHSQVKLCDFGISEVFVKDGDDLVKKGMGSPAFMSPANMRPGPIDIHAKKADVWSLGVTLYCMLRGRLPFEQENPLDLFEAIQSQPIEIPDAWPDEQKDIIRRLLDRDQEKRITVAELRRHPWLEGVELPTEEENLSAERMVGEPTAEEIKGAVKSVTSAFAVIRAVQKFKRLARRAQGLSTDSSRASSVYSTSPPPPPRPTLPRGLSMASSASDTSFSSALAQEGQPPLGSHSAAPCRAGSPTPEPPTPPLESGGGADTPLLSASSGGVSDEPASFSEEPTSLSDELATISDEPASYADEPESYADEPESMYSEEPESLADGPSSHPLARGRQPSGSSSHPLSHPSFGSSDRDSTVSPSSSRLPQSIHISSPTSPPLSPPSTTSPQHSHHHPPPPPLTSSSSSSSPSSTQQTHSQQRPSISRLAIPSANEASVRDISEGLEGRMTRLGMVIVESPGGGREEIG